MSAGGARKAVFLGLSFGAIAAVVLLVQTAGYLRFREVQSEVNLIAENALASIRLVQRMGMAIVRERLLIDRHIFQHGPTDLDDTEREIAVAQEDFTASASRYEPLANAPGEAAAWSRVKENVAASRAPLREALSLSRKNLDTEARAALSRIEPRMVAIDRDFATIVDINQGVADRALARTREIERSAARVDAILSVLALLVTLGVGVSVTRLVWRRDEQIHRYTSALELRNRELDAFAGRVAHDLRGPLTTITVAAERLAERLPQEEGTTAILRRGVQRTERLITDLLALSGVAAQAPGAATNVAHVAAAFEDDLGPNVKEAGGTLRIDVAAAEVGCSEGLLRQALWSLGDNAVKYRRPDVPLTIELVGRVTHATYALRMADNGPGMSSEEASRAFEPLFRGEQARSTPGTGLGLAIVKRIVEASGGTVTVESHVGRGTSVVVSLPLRKR